MSQDNLIVEAAAGVRLHHVKRRIGPIFKMIYGCEILCLHQNVQNCACINCFCFSKSTDNLILNSLLLLLTCL